MTLLDVTLATGYREWMEAGYCNQPGQHPDDWYPETPEGSWAAKKLCKDHCPVIGECLRYALDNSEHDGIWGGTTPPERRKLAKGIVPASLRQPMRESKRKKGEACLVNHPGIPSEWATRKGRPGKMRDYCRACHRAREGRSQRPPESACERNHPGEESEPAFRGNGRWRCRACERVYKKNQRSDAA